MTNQQRKEERKKTSDEHWVRGSFGVWDFGFGGTLVVTQAVFTLHIYVTLLEFWFLLLPLFFVY